MPRPTKPATPAGRRRTKTKATAPQAARRLPGDLSPAQELARALRVDHAGEFGAQQIYRGQLLVLGHKPVAKTLRHMAAQEQEHLETFAELLTTHRVRPTALMPFWRLAGLALGAGTALLGEKAAMACTVAVEEVIIEHYAAQMAQLAATQPALVATLARFQAEEDEHRAIGEAHEAASLPYYPLLKAAIGRACRAAIFISERV